MLGVGFGFGLRISSYLKSPTFFERFIVGRRCRKVQYEGENRNGETISATLFHDSSGNVECD